MRPRTHRTPKPASALVPIPTGPSTEIALPDDVIADARGFAKHSKSASTRRVYAYFWRDFTEWCQAHGRQSLPAAPETVAGYLTFLAKGRNGTMHARSTARVSTKGRRDMATLSISSVQSALAAIKAIHRSRNEFLDSDNEGLKSVMVGIRRQTAKTRGLRRVKPLMDDDLRGILEGVNPAVLREVRDAAMVSLGWAAALRRSELAGLDWLQLGSGTGYVTADDKGLTVTIMTSKASQDAAQIVAVPRQFVPLICKAVEDWIKEAAIQRGTPIFRGMQGRRGSKHVSTTRIDPYTVARAIKQRVNVLIKSRSKGRNKMTKEDIKALTAQFSGHSMRVGHVTSAYESGMTPEQIKVQTRHKSTQMVGEYIRPVELMKHNTLQKIRGL